MAYEVIILRDARKELEALDAATARRLQSAMAKLGDQPRPHGCEKLKGTTDQWRIRVGRFRIVYAIEDDKLLVIVVRIGHRREVYR